MKPSELVPLACACLLIFGCSSDHDSPNAQQPVAKSVVDLTNVPDLTTSDEGEFRTHVGEIVSATGQLGFGKSGYFINTAGSESIYVSVEGSTFTDPSKLKTWDDLDGHQVRIKGKLHFKDYPNNDLKEEKQRGMQPQVPPDYFYIELDKTEIQALDSHEFDLLPP